MRADIPKDIFRELFTEAIEYADRCWIDMLDCKRSWRRMPSDKSIEEILDMCEKGTPFLTCIYRVGRPEGADDFYEFSASTMNVNEPDYYLWVLVKPEYARKLIIKYDLKMKGPQCLSIPNITQL